MGSKGSQTTNTSQSQNYAPTGAGYIQNALQQGQNAAQLPFNIPQAPVAGFSQDQLSAFQNVNNAQGMAQPYINQANQYFQQSAQQPNVASFYNPMAANVTAQMQNIFGQQTSQNNSQLTQAAGGIGADRIAVGQGNLANQQGLAAGQTYAGLWGQAQQAAQQQQSALQSAGYGTAALGSQAQNAALTGAQAQLGTGGLQQQLQQAQLNAPYQQQLAQAAFPYQQAQFNAGITGALAPGLGGTTSGQGTSQSQYNPSTFSQILGGAGSLASIGGYLGGKGSGGVVGYSRGGSASPFGFAAGGSPYSLPSGLNDQPINIDAMNIIPQENLSTGHPNTPTLNLNTPTPNMQPQSGSTGKGSNSGGLGGFTANQLSGTGGQNFLGMSNASQDALQDFMEGDNRGGAVNQPFQTFDAGGTPYDYAQSGNPDTTPALFGDRFPGYLSAGPENAPVSALAGTGMTPDDAKKWPVGNADYPFNPMRMADQAAVQAWRDDNPLPNQPIGTDASGNPAGAPAADSTSPPAAAPTAGSGMPGAAAPAAQQPAGAAPTPDATPSGKSLAGFLKSPYAALLQASLSAFTPQGFAGGMQQGMKEFQGQQSIDQAAKKLAQEAKFHEDQFTRSTPYQQFEMQKPQPMGQTIGPLGLPMTTYGLRDPKTGDWKQVQGGPAAEMNQQDNPIQNIAKAIESGHQPPTLTGMYRMAPMVKSQLEKDGFNLSQATLEYDAAHKQVLSLNGPQMLKFVGLANTVDNTIDRVQVLASQLKNSGIPLLNQLKLQGLINAEGNTPRGQLAAAYLSDVNTLKEEFANLANGGYAPTEPAWKLANEQINGNYGVQELGASLGEVQRLIRYRMQGIPNIQSLGPGSANKYVPRIAGQPGGGNSAAQGAAPVAPPAGGVAAPAFVGRTATNKQTGQKMREIAPDKWEPVQ